MVPLLESLLALPQDKQRCQSQSRQPLAPVVYLHNGSHRRVPRRAHTREKVVLDLCAMDTKVMLETIPVVTHMNRHRARFVKNLLFFC